MALVLESLEVLDLGANENLFNAPEDEAFPVFLGEMGLCESSTSPAAASAPSRRFSASSSRSRSSTSPTTS